MDLTRVHDAIGVVVGRKDPVGCVPDVITVCIHSDHAAYTGGRLSIAGGCGGVGYSEDVLEAGQAACTCVGNAIVGTIFS